MWKKIKFSREQCSHHKSPRPPDHVVREEFLDQANGLSGGPLRGLDAEGFKRFPKNNLKLLCLSKFSDLWLIFNENFAFLQKL